jgi:hypothetical protein
MSRIIYTYNITYIDAGVVQLKNLIEHLDYITFIKPMTGIIETIKGQNKNKHTKESLDIKSVLRNAFGENWFTNKSPLFDAIQTAKLELLPQQGGTHNVFIKKIV